MSRYTTPEIADACSDLNTMRLWREIEVAVLRAQANRGLIPAAWADAAEATPAPDPQQWEAATNTCGHEVVGFLHAWGIPHVHIGLTSSDLVDTALGLRMRDINRAIRRDAKHLTDTLLAFADQHLDTARLGRTHGQAAVPDSLGHKFADLGLAAARATRRHQEARADLEVIKISGPTGAYHEIDPQIEADVAAHFAIKPAPLATQIVARDSLAHWAATCAGLVAVCEGLALEVRLSSHSGVGELAEGHHGTGRKGSSAMPHKHNPTDSERICGLARLVYSGLAPLHQSVAQWHERDIAHSSVERVLVPQIAGATHYAVRLATQIVQHLRVDRQALDEGLRRARHNTGAHSRMVALQLAGAPYAEAHAQATTTTKLPSPPDLAVLRQRIETANRERNHR